MSLKQQHLCISLMLFVTALFLYSCKEKDQSKEIARIVTEWQGKEIVFPENIVFSSYEQDTTEYEIPDSGYKVLLYVDSIGCTSCKLQLHKWSEFIKEVDTLTKGQLPVLFFFHPKDKRELTYLLKRDGITTLVCFDMEDRLNSLNQFPTRDDFQCFLLNEDNKVVCVGNPMYNPNIKEMYLTEIVSNIQPDTSLIQKTTLQVEQELFNLGVLKLESITKRTAVIHNTGDAPLVIQDIEASCDCTGVQYPKEAVLPGSALEVEITFNAEDPGFFDRIIYIYANAEPSPLTIRLEGEVR